MQHLVAGVGSLNNAAGAFHRVLTVVIDPALAQNLQAEVRPFEITGHCVTSEGVGGGANADDRLAGIEVFCKPRELVVGQLPEASADDQQVRGVQRPGAGDVVLEVRVDVAAVRIDRKEHRRLEAMLLAEDLRQHRHRLLGAIQLIACDENDRFAFASTARTGSDFEVALGGGDRAEASQRREQHGDEESEGRFHGPVTGSYFDLRVR